MAKTKTKPAKLKETLYKNKVFFGSFFGLFSVYFLWWLAFFPGTLSPDSLSHWYEAKSLAFTNASPYLYSLILAGLIRIWETPAMMGLLQLLLLTVVVSLFLNWAYKKGANKCLLLLAVAFFALHPVFGLYNVTIWKDVLYSYIVLAALLLAAALQLDEKLTEQKGWWWLLAGLIAFIPLLRFNGIVFFVFLPLLLFATKTLHPKKLLPFLAIQLGIYFFFSIVLFNLLHVAPAPMMQEGIYVKLVGAVYHLETPKLTAKEKEIFAAIMPEETWKKYYQCITLDRLFYEGLPKSRSVSYDKPIDPDPKFVQAWHKAALLASIENPEAVVYDKACMGAYLLGVKDIFYKYEENIYLADKGGPIQGQSKLPEVKKELYQYLLFLSAGTANGYGWGNFPSKIINFIFWSASIPFLVYLAYGYLAIKERLAATGTAVLMMILNLGTVILLVPAASFRYIFVPFAAVPFLPVIYLLEKKDRKV